MSRIPPTAPRGPFVLLGLMTATTVLGPFLIGLVLRGGASPAWPPDRPIEWGVLFGTSGMVALLMLSCISLLWINRPLAPPRPGAVERSAEGDS